MGAVASEINRYRLDQLATSHWQPCPYPIGNTSVEITEGLQSITNRDLTELTPRELVVGIEE